MRLTEKFTNACGGCYEPITNDREVCDKLGQLEDIEEELGVDLIQFLKECKYVLEHSLTTIGKTSKGTVIETDFDFVKEFINEIKEALIKELE